MEKKNLQLNQKPNPQLSEEKLTSGWRGESRGIAEHCQNCNVCCKLEHLLLEAIEDSP